MRLSKYVQSRQLSPELIGLYSPFGHEFAYLSAADWAGARAGQAEQVDPAVIADLTARRFLVDEGFEEEVLGEYLPPTEQIREMWLVVEQACNMACQYCVTEGNVEDPQRRHIGKATPSQHGQGGGHRGSDTMGLEVARAAVEKFAVYLGESVPPWPRVTLYGGEPLLNWPVVKDIVPRIRAIAYPGQKRDKPVQVLVITNGQICRDEIVRLFAENNVAVSVSLDGRQIHHDSQRVDRLGRGTFERAAASLRRYKQAGLNVGICTTIGRHNYQDLPDIVDYLATEFDCPIELQVPFEIPFDGGNKSLLRMAEAAPYAIEAFERLRKKGLLEGLLGRRMMQVAGGIFHHRDCSAVGGQWVVASDGSIGPCHALAGERTFFAGNVLDAEYHPWSNPAFHEWSRRQPVNMPDCHGCSAIAICGGGCPYNALTTAGSIWQKDPHQCDYMHVLIDWLIADVWKNGRPQLNGGTLACD